MKSHSSRRQFLGQASCAAVSSIPVLNTMLNLRLASSLAAVTAPAAGEYRALVCLFLSGGNDSFNMLVPRTSAEYATYQASRSNLALTAAQLIDIHPLPSAQPTFAVHGGMPNLASLFDQGKAAFIANVGTLVEPVSNRTQVANNSKKLPLGLYSHSDQIEQWQTSVPNSRSGIGWAGRLADLMKAVNSNQNVPMNISLDGSNVWQTGNGVAEYSITPGDNVDAGGAVGLTSYNFGWKQYNDIQNNLGAAVDSQLAQQYTNLLQQTFNTRKKQALDAYHDFSNATATPVAGVTFPQTSLGYRMRMIARAIQGRAGYGAVRQTYFLQLGGFDHHSGVIANQAAMLPQVDGAIKAFWDAMVALGMQNNVTLFTASDFGRTLTSNSQGSDHAWGGNQIIVGGSVIGKKIYGQFPNLAVNPDVGSEVNPLDTGRGRFIPTTSCDQFFAELALWLGVAKSDLPLILPNIGNFYSQSSSSPPIGFMA
ncbi:MAG: DUF1501 domain-containing protein [Verrucomicrobiaceae bacterium]|nr:DUF1501 domain-containing protein [Verrucomicrobiaceae bacterium]